jgi:hypothetical protein
VQAQKLIILGLHPISSIRPQRAVRSTSDFQRTHFILFSAASLQFLGSLEKLHIGRDAAIFGTLLVGKGGEVRACQEWNQRLRPQDQKKALE